MKWLYGFLLFIVGTIFVWNVILYPPHEHRYRLTVEIDTPEGIKVGSNVYSVMFDRVPRAISSISGGAGVHGEAIFIQLPENKNIVVLMARGPRAQDVDALIYLAKEAYGVPFAIYPPGADAALLNSKGVVVLPQRLIPTFVSFADLKDPASARVVYATGPNIVCAAPDSDPRNPSRCMQFKEAGLRIDDRIEQAFGKGYALRRVTLEIVPPGIWPLNLLPLPILPTIFGTPVTRGIEGKLPRVFEQLHELDKTLQVVHPNQPLKIRTGHLSVR